MHGPFVFAFEANRQDIQKIIENNDLKKYEKLSDFAVSLLTHLDSHSLPWWKSLNDIEQMEIYGKEYSDGNEPHLKFIFINKKYHVYYLQT